MATIYLQVSRENGGRFYQYSKGEAPGFEQFKNSKDVISFRKYFETISGTLMNIESSPNKNLKNSPLELSFVLKSEDGNYYKVSSMQNTQNNTYSRYAESLIKQLPFLKKGDFVTARFYSFENENGKKLEGVSFKDVNGEPIKKLIQSATYEDGTKKEGDIPAIKFVVKRGETTVDREDQQEYFYNVLTKALEDLKYETVTSPNVVSQSKPSVEAPKREVVSSAPTVVVPEEDDDDLPF